MAHFVRTELDATWTTGNYVPSIADWQSLDAKAFAAINGDLGGCWVPSAPIVVAGTYPGALTVISGPLVVDYGGTLTAADAYTSFRLAGTDWPKFSATHALRTRTILTACMQRQTTPLWLWMNEPNTSGIQSIACTTQFQAFNVDIFTSAITPIKGSATLLQPSFVLPLRVHDGARLVSATLTFRVPSLRTSVPVIPPRMRIVRTDLAGNQTVLKSVASGADPLGYVPVAAPSSGAAWSANSAVQSFTYVCDQNQTIDVSQYTYFAHIIEEVGTLVPIAVQSCDGTTVREQKLEVTVAATVNVATMSGAQTVDGYGVGAAGSPGYGGSQDRVLLTAQTDATQNGIWVAQNTGAWTRAGDMATAADCTPGFLVHVLAGTANAGTLWECTAPTSSQGVKLGTAGDLTGTQVSFGRRVARGNIYHAVACNFDSIANMRWQ